MIESGGNGGGNAESPPDFVSESFSRRAFLKTAVSATGVSTVDLQPPIRKPGLIDVNVNLGRWPSRRLRNDDTPGLVAMLRRQGVEKAWAGSFDGLLHKDIPSVNVRLAEECRRHGRGLLVPFGSINPMLPSWEEELRRCAREHQMPGIRLHPNYHGYKLSDSRIARLLRTAAEQRLIVQLAVEMEDERVMHPLLRVEPVDPGPLIDHVKLTPGLRLVLLNALRTLRGNPALELIKSGDVYVEISMLEGVGGIGNLLAHAPSDRVLFGSHAPFFYFEAAQLKLKESPLTPAELGEIGQTNARRLIAGANLQPER